MGKVNYFAKIIKGRDSLNVLMILDNLSKDSGVSSIVINLFKNIDYQDIKIDFLIFKEGNNSYIEMVKSRGSKVYILPNPLSVRTLFKGLVYLNRFFSEHAEEYDVVHLHSPTLAEFTLKYAKKHNISNRIIHSHSTMTSPNIIKKIINSFLQRNVTRYANYYFACSNEAANFLYGEKFCKTNQVEIVKNAVSTYEFKYDPKVAQEIKNKYNIGKSRLAIHVSNFSKIKNVSFIVPVIQKIINSDTDMKFMFIGDGPTKNEVEKEIRNLELEEYCIFVGRSNEVSQLLNSGDVLFLPSLKEGLPVTLIEAQANGLDCIVTDTVTREANVGFVTYLPLDIEKWTNELLRIKAIDKMTRLKRCELVSQSEFNISNEARRVEKIYHSMRKEK